MSLRPAPARQRPKPSPWGEGGPAQPGRMRGHSTCLPLQEGRLTSVSLRGAQRRGNLPSDFHTPLAPPSGKAS